MARPKGLEPLTAGLEIRCSIRLSYGRSLKLLLTMCCANPKTNPSRNKGTL